MPDSPPQPLRDIVRHRASFGEIEQFIEQLPLCEEDQSALWLWARFGLPPVPSSSGHERLEQRLLGHDRPVGPARRDNLPPHPPRRPELRLTVR